MTLERRALVVVDLGFGDAGKGVVTDFLVRSESAHTVVRFNGGAQAGHNVVTPDGRHHTFAQIGAGAFVPGVRTHLSRFVVVHPTALAREAAHLEQVGVRDPLARVSVASEALCITPFHQAVGRLRELARGAARHGSCGVGVGETVRASLAGHALRMGDLRHDLATLRRIVLRIREHQRAEIDALGPIDGDTAERERALFARADVVDAWMEQARAVADRIAIVDDEVRMRALCAGPGAIVFEGAQGVLLDEHHGFHPHTSWSTCTPANALALLAGFEGPVRRLGVMRTHATRHGAGPFPTEDAELASLLPDPHNVEGPWQGALRVGWPDLVLLRYAIEACEGIDGIAVTHLDALSRRESWRVCARYEGASGARFEDDGARVRPCVAPDLDAQEALGRALLEVRPRYEELPPDAAVLLDRLERALASRVLLTSSGPSSTHVRWHDRLA